MGSLEASIVTLEGRLPIIPAEVVSLKFITPPGLSRTKRLEVESVSFIFNDPGPIIMLLKKVLIPDGIPLK